MFCNGERQTDSWRDACWERTSWESICDMNASLLYNDDPRSAPPRAPRTDSPTIKRRRSTASLKTLSSQRWAADIQFDFCGRWRFFASFSHAREIPHRSAETLWLGGRGPGLYAHSISPRYKTEETFLRPKTGYFAACTHWVSVTYNAFPPLQNGRFRLMPVSSGSVSSRYLDNISSSLQSTSEDLPVLTVPRDYSLPALWLFLLLARPPNGPVLFCWLASVVSPCRCLSSSSSVTLPAGRPAARRVGGRATDTARRASTVTYR